MIERLDARAARWPLPARWTYHAIKWSLAALGAAMLGFNLLEKWGPAAAAWFIVAPLLLGLYLSRARHP